MSHSLTVEQDVSLVNSIRNVSIKIDKNGVEVYLLNIYDKGANEAPEAPEAKAVDWEKLNDVEHLVFLFEYETVKVFKVIVEMLGKINANKNIYLELV